MTDYGSDVSTVPDLDATFALVTGARVVAENVARRCEEVLQGALNADLSPQDLNVVAVSVAREAREDERVLDASASVQLNATRKVLTVKVSLALIEGEVFDFVLKASDVTTEILFGEP